MKHLFANPLFPLQNISPYLRYGLALLPTTAVLAGLPALPEVVFHTPGIVFYPSFILASWLGGARAGFISFISCLIYALIFLHPEILTDPMANATYTMRAVIFTLTCLLFLVLIGALQKALKQAQDAIALRDEFLDFASHELKTPLTALKLNLETATRVLIDEEDRKTPKNILSSSQRQVARLERLILSMMDLTLFDSGQLMLMRTDCDLNKIILDVLTTFKDSDISVTCDEENLLGHWDQVRIEQVISNLIHNAVKYGRGNPIQIRIGKENNLICFSIKDQGAGISQKDQQRIFERFQRANVCTDVQGLGLGLYLSKKLVELHQGKINVKSTPGDGALFTVYLPA